MLIASFTLSFSFSNLLNTDHSCYEADRLKLFLHHHPLGDQQGSLQHHGYVDEYLSTCYDQLYPYLQSMIAVTNNTNCCIDN
jgi:hypothetical protein